MNDLDLDPDPDSGGWRPKRPAAALLSLLQPGCGHLYAGRVKAAIWWWVVFHGLAVVLLGSSLLETFPALVVALGLVLVLLVAMVRGAWRCAALWSGERRWFQNGWLLVPLIVVVGLGFGSMLSAIQAVKTFYIPSISMEPTLVAGDYIMAALDGPEQEPPERGALVIFELAPGDIRVARVVAVAGDTLEIRDKQVWLDGEPLDEPYAVHRDPRTFSRGQSPGAIPARDQMSRLTLPEGALFVLGDNRDNSHDSRFFGLVATSNVRGRALYVYWSLYRQRIGRSLVGPGAGSSGRRQNS